MPEQVYSAAEVDALIEAIPAPTPPPPSDTVLAGLVTLDSFDGANDDDKLTNALSYCGAQTMIPALQFPARKVSLNVGGRAPFSGMKLLGPNSRGPKNLELSGGKLVNHRVQFGSGIGLGAKSWFAHGGTLYDIYMQGLAFQGTSTQQLWSQPSGTLYACEFESLNLYGMGASFGNVNEKCLMTQVVFSGMWTVLGSTTQQFHIGGSDNDFWVSGYCNMGGNGDPNADYWFRLDGVGKTRVGSLYLTAGRCKGIRVSGASEGVQIEFRGVRFEGYHSDKPSSGLIQIDSGHVLFDGGDIGYSKPVIIQNGGVLKLSGVNFERGSYQNQNDPLLIQNGGTAYVWAATISDNGPMKWQGSNIIQTSRRHWWWR
jgi:hypothetical protein